MDEIMLDGNSLDIRTDNIQKLKELFPEIVSEDKINFDMLKTLLSDEIDETHERYEFTWNGKAQAIYEAQKPSTGTLRPCPQESKPKTEEGGGEIQQPLHRRRQPRSPQTTTKKLLRKNQNDIHRPTIQHRKRLHIQRRLS